jgi:hypothetical protein
MLVDVLLVLLGMALMAVVLRFAQNRLEARFNELLRREEERSKVAYKQAKELNRQWASAAKQSTRLFDKTVSLHRDIEILLGDPKVAEALTRGQDGRRH